MSIELIFSAFLIGVLGAGHCIGMCGGISAALAFALPSDAGFSQKLRLLLAYNIGRITSYFLIGLLAGVIGSRLRQMDLFLEFPFLRSVAALMLILMGFYIAGWWTVLSRLERLGGVIWRRLQPIGTQLLPVKTAFKASLLGLIWGWLPCGLVYSTLAFALAQGDPYTSATVMLVFGVGTLPALLVGGLAGERLKIILQKRSFRQVMGLTLIGFGIWTALLANLHFFHHRNMHAAHIGEEGSGPAIIYKEGVPADSEQDAQTPHHH